MRKLMILVSLIGFLLMVNSVHAISGQHWSTEIQCGDFECATPTTYWQPAGATPAVLTNADKHGGTYSYEFQPALTSTLETDSPPANYYYYYIGKNTTVSYWINASANITGTATISFTLYPEGGGSQTYIDQFTSADILNATWTKRAWTNEVNSTVPYGYYLIQIAGAGSTYPTFWIDDISINGSDVSGQYKDYIVLVNCTQFSSTASGALSCTNSIAIPSDCINISTEAWTVITMQNETNLNSSMSFTRYTCNPEGDRVTYCDNLYQTCTYPHINSYPSRFWSDYVAGGNVTSYHIAVLPEGCMLNAYGNFTMIGRLMLTCKSGINSGIFIDEQEYNCTHTVTCFNSNTMEERFSDCTSILTPCPRGCIEGVCSGGVTTTLPSSGSYIDLPAGASIMGFLFTPFTILTFMMVGIGAYFEAQVKSHGAIFVMVILVGSLILTYFGIYPVWVGILLAMLAGGVFIYFIKGIVSG